MFSLTATTTTSKSPSSTTHHHRLSSHFLQPHHHNHSLPLLSTPRNYKRSKLTITANQLIPSPPPLPVPGQRLYQPFRPPPSPIPPQFRNLDTNDRINILANRLALWYEYAPLIPALVQDGFVASTIEELTGISGVEQNRLVVAAQVRESLIQSDAGEKIIEFFNQGGAEILYEIRLLSAAERVEAARYLVENNIDGKGANELARAMKDFPRRRGERGWDRFNYTIPADCLSFMYYRQALESADGTEQRKMTLEKALELAVSEQAKDWVTKELEGKDRIGEGENGVLGAVKVPVVRMTLGEVSESTVVAVFPVCKAAEKEAAILAAPWECGSKGDFGVVEAEKAWSSWVVLPGWTPVAGLKRGGVAVAFNDARALPWTVNRWYKEEAILVVADRGLKEVGDNNGFHLVTAEDGSLKVARGSALRQNGVEKSLGTVVLVVRPPREDTDNQLADEDWE